MRHDASLREGRAAGHTQAESIWQTTETRMIKRAAIMYKVGPAPSALSVHMFL